ncbi:MAG: hypothetical protein JO332_16460, partial [Planctomycetaceae bacterium]|nr:hypothetical protein [Planctomycetaceae bacterium]
MSGLERFVKAGTVLGFIGLAAAMLGLAIFVMSGMVVVENRRAAVLIRKTGDDLPNGEILATAEQKGIQAETLPEGWYWRNPYT